MTAAPAERRDCTDRGGTAGPGRGQRGPAATAGTAPMHCSAVCTDVQCARLVRGTAAAALVLLILLWFSFVVIFPFFFFFTLAFVRCKGSVALPSESQGSVRRSERCCWADNEFYWGKKKRN